MEEIDEKPTFEDLQHNVIQWAMDRQIIPNSTPLAQSRKAGEEVIELIEAAARRRALNDALVAVPALADNDKFQSLRVKALSEFEDSVGDTMVCLINACELAGVDPIQCLGLAWEQIKDRKGYMRGDGIFVKES